MAEISFLYRFDTRSPDQIFAAGFTPKGGGASLIDHFLDISHRSGESAFIGTTNSFEVALTFAREFMQQTGVRQGYIYRINASSEFYGVTHSVRHHLADVADYARGRYFSNYVARLDQAVDDFSWEQEYVTAAPIAGHSISWAMPVRGNEAANGDFSLVQGDIRANPLALLSNSFANSAPYPITLPAEDYAPCSSPELEDMSSSSEDEGPLGAACANDTAAVQSGEAYIHTYQLPDCSFSSSRMKRDARTQMQCSGATVKLVNLSRLGRAMVVISSSRASASDGTETEPRTEL